MMGMQILGGIGVAATLFAGGVGFLLMCGETFADALRDLLTMLVGVVGLCAFLAVLGFFISLASGGTA
jgi:hypothetical protein